MDDINDWAFKQPLSDFYRLGDEKFFILIDYIQSTTWSEGSKSISHAQLLDRVKHDRRYASMIYTAFKKRIERFIQNGLNLEPPKAIKKPAKAKKTKKAKKGVFSSNVVDFTDFKIKKANQ